VAAATILGGYEDGYENDAPDGSRGPMNTTLNYVAIARSPLNGVSWS
jgi:hypothetical protein